MLDNGSVLNQTKANGFDCDGAEDEFNRIHDPLICIMVGTY